MPKFEATTATKRIFKTRKRIRLLAGGMRASKTISVLLYLIDRAQSDTSPTLTSVVSESMPHLRRGAIRDFESILTGHNYWNPKLWNASTFTYTFETGSKIEFFSADQPSKIRGPSRDRLFVNEANNIAQESWEQLLFRTREFAFADWNPVGDFYMYTDYELNDDAGAKAGDDRVDFLILTYKDNEALEPTIVEDIERKAKLNPAWSRVYAEGKRGEMENKIFKGWKIYDEVPHEARLEVRGLDFGYARDPNALCDIYRYNGGYIIDELAYRVGMLNRQTADLILNQQDPNVLTIADSAEQKSIAEMQEYGVNVIGVEKKGRGGETFTNSAIQWVQSQQMGITKRSLNYLKSYRSFMWQTDKDGNIIPKYDHYLSDGMMSVVYGMTNFQPREEDEEVYSTGNFASMWDI
jgi:phage terminase large subunit